MAVITNLASQSSGPKLSGYDAKVAKVLKERNRTAGERALAAAGLETQRQYAENFLATERDIRATAYGTNAGTVVRDIREDADDAGTQADIAAGALGRERRALGLGEISTSTNRRLGLARVLAQVDAGNRSAEVAAGRQRAAQQWGLQQWGADTSDAVATLTQIAQSEQDRYAQYKKAKADRRANIIGTVSGLVGATVGAFP